MILIAGAGIGGLTLGCALKRAGRAFRIFERAVQLRPAGAGIALAPNAFQALEHLGLADRVRRRGRTIDAMVLRDPTGRRIAAAPISEIAPGGVVAMRRTHLQEVLLEALDTPIETARSVSRYENHSDRVRVLFAEGEPVEGELLVAADGLRSAVRRTMRGDEPLRYSGQTSWRAVVEDVPLDAPDVMSETWGRGQRFGIVPLDDRSVYWFATSDTPAGGKDDDVSGRLVSMFEAWHAPIGRILEATPRESILRTDIFDRPPVSSWVDGRAVLLGDAAHPMTPDMGMGGCQAIEDAVTLADALAREGSVDAALARYQERRIGRANRFVTRSRQGNRLAHLQSAPLRWLRNRLMGAIPVSLTARAMASDFEFRLDP